MKTVTRLPLLVSGMRLLIAFAMMMSAMPSAFAADKDLNLAPEEPFTILVVEAGSRQAYVRNAGRSGRRYTACSTFKIANALIALDSGVVAGPESTFTYEPHKHANPHRPEEAYNRDQTLASAFRHSVVWTFQEIARQVGEQRYRDYLARFDYGDQDLSGGLDQFWLNTLEISAAEQIRFLRRFLDNAFGLDPAAVQAVKDMMLLEETDNYRLYGKTGTRLPQDGKWLGWIVGFVESGDRVLYYAINLDADSYPELTEKRMQLLQEGMTGAGIDFRARR